MGRAPQAGAWLLLALLGLSTPLPRGTPIVRAAWSAPAAARDSMVERARKILSDRRYQTALPGPRVDHGWHFRFGSLALGPWPAVLAAVLLALLLAPWLIRRLRADDPEATARADVAPAAGPAGSIHEGIAHAERLAAQGRYSEAAHHLLLVAIEGLTRSERSTTRSHTSRELLRSLSRQMPDAGRSALTELVRLVEVSWFGHHPLAESEFASCLRCCRVVVGLAP